MTRIDRVLGALAALAFLGAALPPALAGDPPPAPAGMDGATEEPALTGDEKAKYDAELSGYDKRFHAIKNRDALIQLFNDLETAGSRAARDFLIGYAKTVKSAEYRVRAFEILSRSGPKAVEFLCGRFGIRSTDSLVQREAVDAVAKVADRAAVGPLLAAIGDSALKMETLGAVCLSLAKIAPDDPKVADALFKAAADRRDTVRSSALEAIGYLSGEKAFSTALDVLQHDKSAVARVGAAKALGRLGKQEAVEALRVAAEDKSEDVRAAAIQALKDLGATAK